MTRNRNQQRFRARRETATNDGRPSADRAFFASPSIGHQLRETYNAWVRRSEAEFEGLGITVTMSLILIRLWQEDGLTQKELIDHTALMQSGTSSALKKMVKLVLVQAQANPIDGREVRYSLTKKGLTLVNRIAPASLRVRNLALQNFTSEDAKHIAELLTRIKENLSSPSAPLVEFQKAPAAKRAG